METNTKIQKMMQTVAQMSIDRASRSLSKIVKTGAKIELENAEMVKVSEVTSKINKENVEVIGAFVDLIGDISFKFLFYTEALNSLTLAELILRKERENMKNFEVYARSAVQEIGNILASSVGNVFSLNLNLDIKPTPPLIIHDYVGVIFEEYLMPIMTKQDSILVIESKFSIVQHDIRCSMFVVPLAENAKIIEDKCNIE